jgi:serine/threonine-protein kinase
VALAPGTRLGPYEVIALIGAGGMGEVYRARDAKLNRDVALKVLPEALAADGDRIVRFRREAQVLAALNHPNIAAIYGFEDSGRTHALVLELVEGPTLADRITKGPIPLDEALAIARQIADALEAAHEQGIIHRDLKPANIKVRDDGTVKVLDFGLAKAMEPMSPTSPSLTNSPTITSPVMMTGMGTLLGTAAYMSPEQAVGKSVDKRTDLWAFGVVLLEMLTGRHLFEGETVSHVLAAVLKDEPDWSALPASTPAAIRTLLRRCLAKDRKQRLPDAAMIRLEIADAARGAAAESVSGPVATIPSRSRGANASRLLAAAIGGAVIVAAMAWTLRPVPPAQLVARYSIQPPDGQDLRVSARTTVGVSRDGAQLAYVATSQGRAVIFIRAVGELASHAIPGTEGNALGPLNPTFAPDGQSIAFFGAGGSADGWELKTVLVGGGVPVRITTTGEPYGLDWGPDGMMFSDPTGIQRVSPSGGPPQRIIAGTEKERLFGPQLLPDGKTVLFTIMGAAGLVSDSKVVAQSLDGGARRVLIEGGSDGRYLPSGHLMYFAGGTIFALPVDPKTLAKKGEAVAIVAGVRRGYGGGRTVETQLAVSPTGTLIYIPGPATDRLSQLSTLSLGSNSADPLLLGVQAAAYVQPRVSPDGRVVAVGREDGPSSDIWLYDLSGKNEIHRLTFGGKSRFPVWSSDSRRVTFQSTMAGDPAIFWQSANGGTPERLTKPAEDEAHVPEAWTRDGTQLLFSIIKRSMHSLWVLRLQDRSIQRFGNVESTAPLSASFSPDRRWIVYGVSSRGQGLLSQDRGVFVEPFPPTGEKHQAPKTAIDFHPVWSPDGLSILYVAAASQPLVSVPVSSAASITFGTPKPLARAPRPALPNGVGRGYDVLPDGRILSVVPASGGATAETANEIRVVLNWFTELQQRVPTR